MRRRRRRGALRGLATLAATALLALGGPAVASAQELTLAVAISMKEAVETLGRSFAAREPEVTQPALAPAFVELLTGPRVAPSFSGWASSHPGRARGEGPVTAWG